MVTDVNMLTRQKWSFHNIGKCQIIYWTPETNIMLHGNFIFWSRAHVVKLGELLVHLSRTEPRLRQWEHWALTTVLPGNSLSFYFLNYINILIFKKCKVRTKYPVASDKRYRKMIHIKGKNPFGQYTYEKSLNPTRKIQNKTT